MSNERLRILIVDDYPLVRKGLQAQLSSLPDLIVVDEAANGNQAIIQAEALQPVNNGKMLLCLEGCCVCSLTEEHTR